MPFLTINHNSNIPERKSSKKNFKLFYSLHGNGKIKLFFIMGLGSPCLMWRPQIEFFSKFEDFQILVYDNRGVGFSDSVFEIYSSRIMAEDALELLDHVGFKENVNVITFSMGGMIAQELVLLDPGRFNSLVLSATHHGGRNSNTPISMILHLFTIPLQSTTQQKVNILLEYLHSKQFLDSKNENGKTNKEIISQEMILRSKKVPNQNIIGILGHVATALTHRVENNRLKKIRESFDDGKKILIFGAKKDIVIKPINSVDLYKKLNASELVTFDCGHLMNYEVPEFNTKILEFLEKIYNTKFNESEVVDENRSTILLPPKNIKDKSNNFIYSKL